MKQDVHSQKGAGGCMQAVAGALVCDCIRPLGVVVLPQASVDAQLSGRATSAGCGALFKGFAVGIMVQVLVRQLNTQLGTCSASSVIVRPRTES